MDLEESQLLQHHFSLIKTKYDVHQAKSDMKIQMAATQAFHNHLQIVAIYQNEI